MNVRHTPRRAAARLPQFTLIFLAFLCVVPAVAQEIVVTPDKPAGVYAAGETVTWTLTVKGEKSADVKEATYLLKRGGLTEVAKGKIDLSSGSATLTGTLAEPGTLLLDVKAKGDGKSGPRGLGGAVFEPSKIQPAAPVPDDFDAFWAAKLKDLEAVPANPQLEAADVGKPNIEYFKVGMDNIKGTHIYGQLAKPKKEGKYPALLIVQWAGVYGLDKSWVTNRAEKGWLTLNIMAHDLPFDRPKEFYEQAAKTTHKDYTSIGDGDREQSYFLRMYLACYRAAEYLSQRDDWDGKTLVVMGTSQGGQQAIVTAGFHPKITAMMANVPAGCDVAAPRVGRAAGFPYFADRAKWKKNEKIVDEGRYFDAANFATRIKCPALVSMGLLDETCPPAGVLATLNQMKGPKEAVVLPLSDHQGKGNSQAKFFSRSEQWLAALVKGEPAPVKGE